MLFFALLFLSAGLGRPVAAQTSPDGLPPRPTPFLFVNDQAQLMTAGDAKKLEGGLRRYADNTGTQIVVVTVPTLGGRDVADYGRALGEAWGVGQRDKNNGIVVLLSGQERKLTIQPGSGLASVITPAVTSRVISQMAPSFKQGNYFAGLRTGLNTLMVTANPGSAPKKDPATAAGAPATTEPYGANLNQTTPAPATMPEPIVQAPALEPASSGPGMGTLLIGALVIGGGLWLLLRMFRSRSAAPANATPNFMPGRPNGPVGNYGPGQAPGNYGPGYGNMPNQGGMMGGGMMGGGGGGMGVGGILATGAAAAAGAYIGNRMASNNEPSSNGFANDNNNAHFDSGAAAGAGAAGTGAASDYFASHNTSADNTAPDYFADNAAADNSSDYFSSDSSSYDDTSSGDTGGGGFDSTNDNSGSW